MKGADKCVYNRNVKELLNYDRLPTACLKLLCKSNKPQQIKKFWTNFCQD